jgi:23S rRNA (cytidine1920-2'-O)/16S rRNA (cytidine1409-2'-O)-methyltransferase
LKKRIDQWVLDLGLAPTKTKAKDLILNGSVFFKGKKIDKPGFVVSEAETLEIKLTASDLLKYVSRGGLKLEGALKKLNITVKDLTVLDVGSSTGGFSHCLLKEGAKNVIGIDVGTNQIHPDLKRYTNFIVFENVHFQDAESVDGLKEILKSKVDFVVADLSFITAEKLLPYVKKWLNAKGEGLILIKPQFELSPQKLNKKGIVKNKKDYQDVKDKFLSICKDLEFAVKDYFESSLLGKDGNTEFFLYIKKLY